MNVGYYFGSVLEKMEAISERDKRGKPYSLGFGGFCLFLCTCAGRNTGRSKSIWLECNAEWINKVWLDAGFDKQPGEFMSQPTLSRTTRTLNQTEFPQLMAELQKETYFRELKVLFSNLKKINLIESFLPIYAADGKSREGCISEETGRTEVDLNVYNPETNTLVGSVHLEDKQGERAGLEEFLEDHGESLPPGIVTADAGITSRYITELIVFYLHSYLLKVKGNSGEAFNEIVDLPWNDVKYDAEQKKEENGRAVVQRIQVFDANFIDEELLIHEFADLGAVYRIESFSNDGKKITDSISYLIGSNGVADKSPEFILRTAKLHWSVETFHSRKDVTLKEDASMQRVSNGSRTLSRIRSFVDHIGQGLFGSTKEFLDRFSAAPERMAFGL
jgi:hypothetical protein